MGETPRRALHRGLPLGVLVEALLGAFVKRHEVADGGRRRPEIGERVLRAANASGGPGGGCAPFLRTRDRRGGGEFPARGFVPKPEARFPQGKKLLAGTRLAEPPLQPPKSYQVI